MMMLMLLVAVQETLTAGFLLDKNILNIYISCQYLVLF